MNTAMLCVAQPVRRFGLMTMLSLSLMGCGSGDFGATAAPANPGVSAPPASQAASAGNPQISASGAPTADTRQREDGCATQDPVDVGVPQESLAQQTLIMRTMSDSEPVSQRAENVLSVQFAPQVLPGTWSKTMSCGPAALNMAGAYHYRVPIRQEEYIRKINRYLGKRDIDNCLPGGTSVHDLARAAKAVNGLPATYVETNWNLDRLRQRIDRGQPVVVAVWAGHLPNRGYSYAKGHFVLVVGYDGQNIVCHDPGTRNGAARRYRNQQFMAAMAVFRGSVVVPQR